MEPDREGFLYPVVDSTRCTHCDVCQKSCKFRIYAANGLQTRGTLPLEVCAAKNKEPQIRRRSSSGGVFMALCRDTVSRGGVVYGARFGPGHAVIHDRAEDLEGCRAFMGAKYVQSDLGGVYGRVRSDLAEGRAVLFSGTPCQIAGLQSYMEHHQADTAGLLTCDLVCHGVASPLVWRDYLESVRGDAGIASVSFRDKARGWRRSELRVERTDGSVLSEDHGTNPYSQLFFSHYTLRPSCSVCPYASMRRVGDITIGDFWGIEDSLPEFSDDEGVSLVLVDTGKGRQAFDRVRRDLEVRESGAAGCSQPSLQAPSALPGDREEFWRQYGRGGFPSVVKRYTGYGRRSLWDRLCKAVCRLRRKVERRIIGHDRRTI